MNNVELERAAIAPRRWIELFASFATGGFSGSEARLSPTATRIINNPFGNRPEGRADTKLILVPGGRYMVGYSRNGLRVWDLGYMSSADCKLIASLGPAASSHLGDVHATPDGMGLIIFLLRRCRSECNWSCYEIYPQSETPQLTQIAYLDFAQSRPRYRYIFSDNIIWYAVLPNEIIFRVWDYRLNASVSFTVEVDVAKVDYSMQVLATKTAIVILHQEGILIWAIPPLSQPANFDFDNLARLPPLIRLKFPDDLALQLPTWRTLSSWYFGSSQPLYFDMVHAGHLRLQRFKLIIKPDLSDATIHLINILQLTARDSEGAATPSTSNICEDILVSFWDTFDQCGIYTGSILSHPTNTIPFVVSMVLPVDGCGHSHSLCPASGRFVHLDWGDIDRIVVFDFLPLHGPDSGL
ncbi:hypothetical protein BYT27DRAFT_7193348 [Phlegmacium glaucopus]|nr:hypothetical protein BYT27DRAFT_7193348 [Phlegmacium glaucopus]